MERKESPAATIADQGDHKNAAHEPKINPATGRPTLPRAPKACARCRRQKLRCDPFRPCALCVRACVECVNQNPDEVAETRKANKAKREEKKQREIRSSKSNDGHGSGSVPRDGSPVHKMATDSQSPEQHQQQHDSNFDDERPRKRPRYIAGITGEPFPFAEFSSEDTEKYIQQRRDGNEASSSYDSSSSSTKREPLEDNSTPENTLRQQNSEIVTELNRVKPFPEPAPETEKQIRDKLKSQIAVPPRGEGAEEASPKGMRNLVGGTSAIGLTREVFAMHSKGLPTAPSTTFNVSGTGGAGSGSGSGSGGGGGGGAGAGGTGGSGVVGGSTTATAIATTSDIKPQHQHRKQRNYAPRTASSRQSVMAQLMLLPSKSLADFLIETYMLSVHWFICCVHEPTFRKRYEELMQCREEVLQAKERMVADEDGGGQQKQHAKLISLSERVESDENFTFAMLILSVCLLGAQYTLRSPVWQEKMHALQPEKSSNKPVKLEPIMARLSARIKLHMLDIVSLGDLSSLSICIIMGSYYLFLGEPNMSWPILGCGIKVAHTLALHRALQEKPPPGYTKTSWVFEQQLRRRVWWALHVYDRFAAMVYGRPLGINDDDCDVGLPFNIDDDRLPPRGDTDEEIFPDSQLLTLDPRVLGPHTSHAREEPHLFTYAHKKCGIYYIIGEAMRALYRLNGRTTPHQRTEPIRPSADPSKVQELIASVAALDKRLKQWYASVPPLLKDISTKPIPGVDSKTERTYKLQALALQLAFDSAVILIHRPMLGYQVSSYKRNNKSLKSKHQQPSSPDPFRSSAEECWHAALRTSTISKNPGLFEQIQSTHAVSFLGIHLFNAGVVLCISAINEPLSIRSHEAKLGVGRILAMQKGLTEQTPIASQGSQILQDLVRLVMNREMESIFVSGGDMKSSNGSVSSSISDEEQEEVQDGQAVQSTHHYHHGNTQGGDMGNTAMQGVQQHQQQHQQQSMYPMMRDDHTMSFGSFSPAFDVVENQAVNQTLMDLEKVMDNSSYDITTTNPPNTTTTTTQQLSPPQPSPPTSFPTPLTDTWSNNMDMQSPNMFTDVTGGTQGGSGGGGGGGGMYMQPPYYSADWANPNVAYGNTGVVGAAGGGNGGGGNGGGNGSVNVMETGQTWIWGAHRL